MRNVAFGNFIAAVGVVSVGLLLTPSGAGAAAPVTITVEAGATGKAISPDLFGIFFEDLNYAADGGLYAELVQNRSFEYSSTEQSAWNEFSFWKLEKRGEGAGRISVKTAVPLHPNNPHYVALMVKQPGDGVGVSNDGYNGIPLTGGEPYRVSFFSHQLFMGEEWSQENSIDGKPMPVSFRLETASGELLGESAFSVSGRAWRRYEAQITPAKTEKAARLVVLAKAQGGIALDEVSVFPVRTFRDRPNGLRRDLAQVIADLKPKFVRFPGGCLVHGDGLTNLYHWKHTIGPVEQRKGQRNLWGYHQSLGLGYFEYFQFCEDIGAKPLPVVAAGVCCQNGDSSPGMGQQGLPMEHMQAYIQDVLDLIEWANGPATSEWGAKRAAAGHPEPFGLKYLGVGNEDKITDDFEARFRLIHDAVKAKHPEIVVIGTSGPFPDGEDFDRGWAFARKTRVPMVDEHYYRAPEWFWSNLHRYDGYDRNGPKVYVGEYAAHEKNRKNTLRTAIAEAAGMIGFERNGDVVHFASYAPLLARRGNTQWTPDLIYFNGTEVYPSVNYYVQQLFAVHSGDRLLPTALSGWTGPETFLVSAVRDTTSQALIVKIVNGGAEAVPYELRLAGLAQPGGAAQTFVLSHTDPDFVNEDNATTLVRPVVSQISLKDGSAQSAPPYSVTVLRFQ